MRGTSRRGMPRALPMAVSMTLFLAALGVGMTGAPVYGQDTPERIAADVASDLANHRIAEIVARFTPDMAMGLPAPTLDKVWSGVLQHGGAVRELGPARLVQVSGAGAALVIVPIRLERMALDLKVSVAHDKVAGLFMSPAEAPAPAWSAPAYVEAAAFTDVEVTIGAAPTALGGTLSLPKTAEKVPAVVLIHGSGPNDRDETIGPNRPFRDIAEGLASRGVAVLRFDKRTKVHREQLSATATVREETMDDVVAAVALLAARKEIDADRIVIVGHSLGGTVAPRIAAGGHGIAGVVIMAGASRPLPVLLVEQVEYLATLNGPPDEAALRRIAEIKSDAARAMAAQPGDTGAKILGASPTYWADLNAYDPASAAAQLSVPLLILQGGRDYQVRTADLQRFKAALAEHPNATIREFPKLNHLFMAGEGKSRPEDYRIAGHVDGDVIETLAQFVAGVKK